jgi:hypothetical protein
MHMMTVLTGRERSAGEFAQLLMGAGFEKPEILATRSPFRVVQAPVAI